MPLTAGSGPQLTAHEHFFRATSCASGLHLGWLPCSLCPQKSPASRCSSYEPPAYCPDLLYRMAPRICAMPCASPARLPVQSSRALRMTTAILTGTGKHYNSSAPTRLTPNNAPVAKQIYSDMAGMWERMRRRTLRVVGTAPSSFSSIRTSSRVFTQFCL